LLFLVLLLHTPSAHADPIPIILITGGSVDLNAAGNGHLDVRGTRDFRMNEVVESQNALGMSCRPCVPGDLLNLGGGFAEEFGTGSVGGVTSEIQGGGSHFVANGVAPPFGTSGVLSVPFTYLGVFQVFEGPRFQLRGQGTATVQLLHDIRNPNFPLWEFGGARFDFAAAPTPEPATIFLIGSGLAAVAWRRRASRTRAE